MVKSFGLFLIVCLIIIAGFWLFKYFSPIQQVKGASADSVSGWAWSGFTAGWISLDSLNCDSDENGITDSENFSQCPVGQSVSSYGVNIDKTTGDFSGYAWSSNVGWISFNRADTGNPPEDDPGVGSGPIANYNSTNGRVLGWARAVENDIDWDGWIKLGDNSGTWSAGGEQVYIDPLTKNFGGWAWGGDNIIGWVSFSSRNCDPDGDGDPSDGPEGCVEPGRDYSVNPIPSYGSDVNYPPTASADRYEFQYCVDSLNPTLYWNYEDPVEGSPQESFWVQIDLRTGDFSSPVLNTGARNSSVPSPGIGSYHPEDEFLQWSTEYKWRVKAKDEGGKWSPWSDSTTPASQFETLPHAYPKVRFDPFPKIPSAGENITFLTRGKSACYDDVITGSDCTTPNDTFSWTFTPVPPNIGLVYWDEDGGLPWAFEEPVVSFSNKGSWEVTLEIADSDAVDGTFTCSLTKTIYVTLPIPGWKEIMPK